MNFNKTKNIQTATQLRELIERQKEFFISGDGRPAPFSHEYSHLLYRNDSDSISVRRFTWVNKTVEEIRKEELAAEAELKKQQDADALIASHKADIELWRDDVLKPWSISKFKEWVDDTYMKPLKHNLTTAQVLERKDIHAKILAYYNQAEYKTDLQLDLIKPDPPSWIS